MSDNKKIIGSLILGVAAGAAIGMLFAPRKGSKTRTRISESTDDLIEELKDTIEDGKLVIRNFKKKAVSKYEGLKDFASQKENEIFEDAEAKIDYLKNKATSSINNL